MSENFCFYYFKHTIFILSTNKIFSIYFCMQIIIDCKIIKIDILVIVTRNLTRCKFDNRIYEFKN
jgi:hypothetical protein